MNLNRTMSIAIMSGKGGVGKTNLALNLARMLYLSEEPSLLLDCDLGLANLDVLLGLNTSYTLQDIVQNGVAPKDAIVPIEGRGFDFIPAASGLPELAEMDDDMLALLFSKLESSLNPYNFLFLDLGAGISSTVLSFASLVHTRVVIITPEPTSITDGYALMKVLNAQYGITDFNVVVNQVENKQEYNLACQRISAACNHFLGFKPNILGCVNHDNTVMEAVMRQIPFTKYAPNSEATKGVQNIVRQIMQLRCNIGVEIQKGIIVKNNKKIA